MKIENNQPLLAKLFVQLSLSVSPMKNIVGNGFSLNKHPKMDFWDTKYKIYNV